MSESSETIMLGACIGDIVGSAYEWQNIHTKEFPLFQQKCRFTDDTVFTCGVAWALREFFSRNRLNRTDGNRLPVPLADELADELRGDMICGLKRLGGWYPYRGCSRSMMKWIFSDSVAPLNRHTNGSAMRCSPAAWYASSLEQALDFAARSAEITHNHPEGIAGAEATAGCIYLARDGKNKDEIRAFASSYYDLNISLDAIRSEDGDFDCTCAVTVPQAIVSFLEAEDFEDAIRNAVSLGGDTDTIAAIAGSIAEPFFGIPDTIRQQAFTFLDQNVWKLLQLL